MLLSKVVQIAFPLIYATGTLAEGSNGDGNIDQSFFTDNIHRSVTIASQPETVRIRYVDTRPASSSNATSQGTILLLHGWPSTSYGFHKVLPLFTQAGYRVIAPDNRGAGDSNKPLSLSGYTKFNMATDFRTLLQQHLNITGPIHVVGHDIGAMIAHAYTAQWPDEVSSVVWGEATLSGSTFYNQSKDSELLWHYNFLRRPDLAEVLTKGKVREFIKFLYDGFIVNWAGITPSDLDYIAAQYEQTGGMRCGANLYRTFDQDAEDNLRVLKENGKSKVPAMALFSALLFPQGAGAGEEFYENQQTALVQDSGHYVAEENPEAFVNEIVRFIGGLGQQGGNSTMRRR